MFARHVVLLLMVVGVPRAAFAQEIPPNVDAGVFAADMTALIGRSDTFRAQCDRLAAARHVRVKIVIAASLDGARGQTTIRRLSSGAIRADVEILFGENYRELLAHEFEHILEQVDGVDLRHEAAEGRAWLLPGGAFETRRAHATGIQVRNESEPSEATRFRAAAPYK